MPTEKSLDYLVSVVGIKHYLPGNAWQFFYGYVILYLWLAIA